jgi:hypothetical protein
MALSPHTTRLLASYVASALVAVAISAPAAQASVNHQSAQQVPFITEHSAGQNGTGHLNAAEKYGPLDPVIAAAILNHQSAQPLQFITEHSASQNGTGRPSATRRYGPLDPIVANAILNHPREQNGASKSTAAPLSASEPNGFDWGAAGIGATVALAAMLLGLGVARFIPRRSRPRLA